MRKARNDLSIPLKIFLRYILTELALLLQIEPHRRRHDLEDRIDLLDHGFPDGVTGKVKQEEAEAAAGVEHGLCLSIGHSLVAINEPSKRYL